MSIAVVTGASSGIGREFVLQLEKENDINEFWLIARRRENLEKLANNLSKPCKLIVADLSTSEGLNIYKSELENERPQISYLVNSAGYGEFGSYKTVNTEIAFNMIDLNVKALVFVTQESIPYMPSGAHIIELGSASTYHPLPNFNIYASSKSFVKHYSVALREELKELNISVTVVCPGWVKTEFFDRAKIDATSEKSFAKPMVLASDVVKKAIKDAKRNKSVSRYALFNNTHYILSRIMPHSLMIFVWQKMQK